MTYSILIPLRNGNPDDQRGRIPWWAEADIPMKAHAATVKLVDIIDCAKAGGCSEIVLGQPFGTARGLRVESDQISRLSLCHKDAIVNVTGYAYDAKMRTALFTGFGWPNQPWSPFRWRYGTVSRDGKWRYPNVESGPDRRAVFADLAAAKSIGFDSVWIDQLASVNGEFEERGSPDQGNHWAWHIQYQTGLPVVGEAHWPDDSQTSMVSLGREIDARGTLPRHRKGVRDIVWINGHGTVNGMADGPPVRTPADQVAAGRRYAALGFEVCYEVDSVQTMRGIVEARNV